MGSLFFGRKSLDDVACKGDVTKLRKLVAKGANVNVPCTDAKLYKRFPLHAAAAQGQVAMVEALLNMGAEVDVQDMMGRTPLHLAVHALRNEVVPILLNCGADYTKRDNFKRMPIHIAVAASNGAAKEMLLARALETHMEFAFWEQGHWYPYDEAAAHLLSFELGDGVGFAALALGEGATYIVDFSEHLQLNVSSLFIKSVSWRVLPNGKWNRPPNPIQGLHPGSQDPRLLFKYDTLLRSLASQGVAVCPLYFQLHSAIPGATIAQGRAWAPAEAAGAGTGANQSYPYHPGPAQPPLPTPAPGASEAPALAQPSSRLPQAAASSASSRLPQAASMGAASSAWGVDSPGEASEPSTPLQRTRPGELQRDDSLQLDGAGPSPGPGPGPGAGAGAGAGASLLSPAGSLREYEVGRDRAEEAVTLQPLRSGTEEYNEVAARFLRGMEKEVWGAAPGEHRPVTVSSIARVKMPWHRVEPFSKARAGLKARWGTDNVRRGWHGGPRAGLERILEKGFVLSAQGRNRRMYGDGVYLAAEDHARVSAEFAPADEHGTKHVLLCVVALGSMEQIPFDSTQRRPSNVMRFDTGVDNLEAPTRFIIWEEDMQDFILPTHLLSFRYC